MNPYNCTYCFFSTQLKSNYTRHMNSTRHLLTYESKYVEEPAECNSFECKD